MQLQGGKARHPNSGPILWLTSAAVAMGIAGVVSLSVDNQLAGILEPGALPGDLRRAVTLSEAFAHGLGAAAILGAVALSVAPNKRPAVWTAVLITLLSGLTANALKAGFVRVRPHSVGLIQIEESAWFSATATADAIAKERDETGETTASAAEPDFWDSRQRSFPSGHSATAWALAIGLSLAFPRATGVFIFLAVLASIQRISSGAHYPSDVFAGAVIACLSAIVILLASKLRTGTQAVQSTPSGTSAGAD
ncbi:MAG: hypothetical protein Aurels2KO_51540 [Aureliella sp.]